MFILHPTPMLYKTSPYFRYIPQSDISNHRCLCENVLFVVYMKNEDLRIIPYTATSLSVIGRFIFMFLIYKNKSTNSLSLVFCMLSIASSSMWIYYSVQSNDTPMIVRSSTEITLLTISSVYIIRNKLIHYIESRPHEQPIPVDELAIRV